MSFRFLHIVFSLFLSVLLIANSFLALPSDAQNSTPTPSPFEAEYLFTMCGPAAAGTSYYARLYQQTVAELQARAAAIEAAMAAAMTVAMISARALLNPISCTSAPPPSSTSRVVQWRLFLRNFLAAVKKGIRGCGILPMIIMPADFPQEWDDFGRPVMRGCLDPPPDTCVCDSCDQEFLDSVTISFSEEEGATCDETTITEGTSCSPFEFSSQDGTCLGTEEIFVESCTLLEDVEFCEQSELYYPLPSPLPEEGS